MSDAALSPSLVHERLMRENEPRLRFRGGDVGPWRRELRARLAKLLGIDRMPRNLPPPRPRTLWSRDHELGRIEKLRFTAEPGNEALAYLCLPDPERFPPPWPVFVCLQGHTTGMHNSIGVAADDEVTPIEVPGDRDFGLQCMARGIAGFCLEQRAFGQRAERRQKDPGPPHLTCHTAAVQAMMLGRTLVGERVYDVGRAIDLVQAHGDRRFDLRRLGVTGNSGGGLVALLAGALLSRVRFVMPSCGFCTYRDSIMTLHHCVDNYIPGLLIEAEMGDVLGLAAPKPLVVVAGEEDPIFPIHGVRKAFRQTRAIYRASGAADACELAVGPGGHRYYADLAWGRMLPRLQASAARRGSRRRRA